MNSNNKYYILILSTCLILNFSSYSQNVLDGVYEKQHVKTRKVIPYSPLREADVMWSKRIWREIDMNEKINLPMSFPDSLLTRVIMDAIAAGELTAYEDENFKEIKPPDEVIATGASQETSFVVDPITFEEVKQVTSTELDYENDVRMYKIKEDWFFDKQRSVMEPRIIGVAPYWTKKKDGIEVLRLSVCWLYYPELRFILANAEMFNTHNDASRMSYLDLFDKRMFSSYIVQESNVYARTISSYVTGADVLYEAERIKKELILYEHDLWHY